MEKIYPNVDVSPSKRSFGGKLDNFESNYERNYEKKHLKAYLNGDKKFRHGYRVVGEIRFINWFDVKENWS